MTRALRIAAVMCIAGAGVTCFLLLVGVVALGVVALGVAVSHAVSSFTEARPV